MGSQHANADAAGMAGSGRVKVLLAEDSPIVALDMAHTLEQAGFAVIGPAFSLEDGLRLAGAFGPELGWAVLDFDLGGEKAQPIAEMLMQWSVPVVWCSGYSDRAEAAFAGSRHLQKPIDPVQLVSILRSGSSA